MIYELVIVAHPDSGEEKLSSFKAVVEDVVKLAKGDIAVQDDWGNINFAQSMDGSVGRGHFLYFIYKGGNTVNEEMVRRLGISEGIVRHMITKLGVDEKLNEFVKKYRTPFSKKYAGTVLDIVEAEDNDTSGSKKRFVKNRGCWFSRYEIAPDWKDPASYTWLLNEFGKISPSRISGITRQNQTKAVAAIKRARQLGLVSYVNNEIARQ